MLTTTELERIEREVLTYPEYVQQRYYDMVAAGQSPRFALMCACQKAPMTRQSDRTFNVERQQVMSQMKPKMRDKYLKLAKQSGIATQGKYYVGALGRPTDPMAWVSTVDEAKAVCKAKNLTASGIVEHKGHQVDPPKKIRMAQDIKDRMGQAAVSHDVKAAERYAKDPSYRTRVQAEVEDRHAASCTG